VRHSEALKIATEIKSDYESRRSVRDRNTGSFAIGGYSIEKAAPKIGLVALTRHQELVSLATCLVTCPALQNPVGIVLERW
jgi:hypothetical protein